MTSGIGIFEKDAFFCQLVDRRSFMELTPVTSHITLTKIVDEEEDDVGSAFGWKV